MDERTFQQVLAAGVKYGASDVHFKAGMAPMLRVTGDLNWIKAPKLTAEDTAEISRILMERAQVKEDASRAEVDTSYEIPELGRFRVNIFRQMGRHAIIMRIIPLKVPTYDSLGLPKGVRQISGYERGLVLVTGATGSGKTSTLAAIINDINQNRKCHIITIEDPIEFVHQDIKSSITQREIGLDTPGFASALRAALREDPDVILVGEMRDYETIDIALKAAETGHLVFSTVHTTDASKTINRLMSVFPANEQDAVRFRLSEALVASVSQRLLPLKEGKGMVAACEIMISTLSIKECISLPEKLPLINDFIAKGRELLGSQTFDQHLAELFNAGKITVEVAKSASSNPGDFERALQFE